MARHLSLITVLVDDYDQAIAFYVGKLGFSLSEDRQLSPDKRWVVVTPQDGGTGLLLAKAASGRQIAVVGNQAGGRVFLFLETDDFKRDHAAFSERGVRFLEAPREEPYGMVAVFEDLYGNRWDLIEPR
jgi:catechol 2,3-dioxygenase-like lactoylglutathione lyase family enzyme